ncbi:MAG: hypothetical protein ACE5EE_10880 [Fidelibacterota bacterium]
MDIISGVASIFTGGLAGIVSSGVSIYAEAKKHKAKIEQKKLDLEMVKVEAEQDRLTMALELEHADKIHSKDLDTQLNINQNELLKASYESDKATYSKGAAAALERLGEYNMFANIMAVISLFLLVAVDALRAATRPVITGYLVYAVIISTGDIALNAKIFLTTSAVSWWFASRSMKKTFSEKGKK